MAGTLCGVETVMNVTDAAVEKAVLVRSRETDPDRYALWVEVIGVQGGEYAYDLSLQPLAEAPADAHVADLGRIAVVIPAESVELLRGATLDREGDLATGGLVIHNRPPPSPAIGVPATADLERRHRPAADPGARGSRSTRPSPPTAAAPSWSRSRRTRRTCAWAAGASAAAWCR